MRPILCLAMLISLVGTSFASAPTHGSVGRGQGVTLPDTQRDPCGTLLQGYDGTFENAYCWQYGGIVPPYYGAFAIEVPNYWIQLCGIRLMLTGTGGPCQPCDLYVWADDGGRPGDVLAVIAGANPCPVVTWPNVSAHDFSTNLPIMGTFWVGYWAGGFSNSPCGYYVGADLNGGGNDNPMTNIAPGLGYPTGWNDVSVVWGPTQALGIAPWLFYDTPVNQGSWGRIKHLYR